MTVMFHVEVAYVAADDRSRLIALDVPSGTTVWQAVEACGMLDLFPEIDRAGAAVGIFGHEVSLSVQLADGDRVEIYRPLMADPKSARRRRAELKKNTSKSNTEH